jgi:hypothetical protein
MSTNGHPAVPSVGRFEDAHGRQAQLGETLTFAAVPDGVRSAPALPAAPEPPRTQGRFTAGPAGSAASAARRKAELAKVPDFARQELEFTPTADFAAFDRARRDILAGKLDELERTFRTGPTPQPCSSGVASVVRGWAWLVAFAEYYAVRAAKTGSTDDAELARKFVKDASIELAKAHELMRAESAARRADPRASLFAQQQEFQRQLAERQKGGT